MASKNEIRQRGSRWESERDDLHRQMVATPGLIAIAVHEGNDVTDLREHFARLMGEYNALHGAGPLVVTPPGGLR